MSREVWVVRYASGIVRMASENEDEARATAEDDETVERYLPADEREAARGAPKPTCVRCNGAGVIDSWECTLRCPDCTYMTDSDFAVFLEAYITCALWSSTDNADDSGGEPLDANYNESDLTDSLRSDMRRDCSAFVADQAKDLEGLDPSQCGHDFWLTRNGHGTGFWDRGLGEKGARLSKACKTYGSVELYVNEDGEIAI